MLPLSASTADALLCSLAITIGIFKHGMSFDKYRETTPLKEQLIESISCYNPSAVVSDKNFKSFISSICQEYPKIDIYVRASGTEPKVRVSLQSDCSSAFKVITQSIKSYIESKF